MEWEKFGTNVLANANQTVLKVYRLLDLPKELSFYKSLDTIDEFKVTYQSEGDGRIKDRTTGECHNSKHLVKMQSKYGNVSYFDPALVEAFVKESSMLYLPVADNDIKAPLIVTNADGSYVIFPYIVDDFIEILNMDNFI